MSQADKPSDQHPKRDAARSTTPLPDEALEKIAGGKANVSEITVTKTVDKSSPKL
jgi:hypothetical protein